MRLLAAGTVALLLLASVNSFASEPRWVKLSQSLISSSYIDVHDLPLTAQSNHLYTVKTVPGMAGTIDEEYEHHDVGYVILHGEMNCFTNTYNESSVEIFSTAGTLIGTEQNNKGFRPVDEMTLEGALNRFFCRRRE